MKVLVTGGAGYIGSHVVKALGEKGFDVVIYDNLSSGTKKSILHGEFVEGDLSDEKKLEDLFKQNDIDAVIHMAASISVPESVEKPLEYYSNNTQNSLNLLRFCKKSNVRHFIFSSTAAVYGDSKDNWIVNEDSPVNPQTPYAWSKLMTETIIKDVAKAYGNMNYAILRYFNVAGADLDLQIGQFNEKANHLIKCAVSAAVANRNCMSIYGQDYDTEDGTCIRDFIHVADLAAAHVCSLEHLINGGQSGIYNCGYGKGVSVMEVVNTVKKISATDFNVEYAPRRTGDIEKIISNPEKIIKDMGWRPKYNSLDIIIKSALDWEQKQFRKPTNVLR